MKTSPKPTLALTLLAGAMGLTTLGVGIAQASPTFTPDTFNEIFFQDFENIYRTDASCAQNGGCLGAASGPAGFQMLNPTLSDNLATGDVVTGIFKVQNIDAGGSTQWSETPGVDEFTGYFAHEVVFRTDPNVGDPLDGADPFSGQDAGGASHLTYTQPTTDPFGILAAGEMYRLWVDDGGAVTQFSSGGSSGIGDLGGNEAAILAAVLANIADATDGTFWGSLGTGAVLNSPVDGDNDGLADDPIDEDGYGYAHINVQTPPANLSDQEAFFGMDLVTMGPAYNAGLLALINDLNENEVGGISLALLCSLGEIASNLVACNQVVGTAEIEANPGFFQTASSPWVFRSNDPFGLLPVSVVPEPGIVGLLGLGLLGLAGLRRRKRS